MHLDGRLKLFEKSLSLRIESSLGCSGGAGACAGCGRSRSRLLWREEEEIAMVANTAHVPGDGGKHPLTSSSPLKAACNLSHSPCLTASNHVGSKTNK